MFSSAVNTVNAVSATGKASISYSMNKAQVTREIYIPEGPGFNVAPGAVKVPESSSKKRKFP
jgi:hypothetical protein